jgi:PAS domain S-box-containing protein
MNFTTKVASLMSGMVLLTGLVVSYVVYTSNVEALEKQIKKSLEDHVIHTMKMIDRMLFERLTDIKVMASDPIISSGDFTPKEITKRLIEYRSQYKTYTSLSFFDLNRIRIADTAGLHLGKQHKVVQWSKDTMDKGIISIASDIGVAEELKMPIIYFASPVKDKKGEPFGVVVARMPVVKLHDLIRDVADTLGEKVGIDLVQRNGLLLYSSYNRQGILKYNMADREAVKRSMAGERAGSLQEYHHRPGRYGVEGEDIFVFAREQGYLDFKGNDWTLVMHAPREAVFAPAIELRNRLILVFLIAAAFSIFIVLFFSRKISEPIIRLRNVAGEIGKGNLDLKIEVTSKDEIGQLSASFNKMTKDLQKSTVSKEIVDNIIKSMMGALVVVDSDSMIRMVNQATLSLLGYEEEDLIGQPVGIILAEEAIFRGKGLDALIRKGFVANVEKIYLARDGSRVPVLFSGSVMRDAAGKLQGIVCVALDIRERKRSEEVLRVHADGLEKAQAELNQTIAELENAQQATLNMMDDAEAAEREALQAKGQLERNYKLLQESETATLNMMMDVDAARERAETSEQELIGHRKALFLFAETANSINGIRKYQEICEIVCRDAMDIFQLEACWVSKLDEDGNEQKPIAYGGSARSFLSAIHEAQRMHPGDRHRDGMAIKSLDPLLENDIEHSERYELWRNKAMENHYHSSLGNVLISARDKVYGTINLYSGTPYFFTEARIRMVETLAHQTATCLENVGLIEGLEERVRQRTTELEQSAEELRKTDIEYRTAQKIGKVGSFAVDLTSGRQTWSDQIYRMLGLEPDEIPATHEAFIEYVHPDDREHLDQASQATFAGNSDLDVHYRIISKDGETRHIHTRATIERDENGKPVMVFGYSQDISDRKQAQEALEEMAMFPEMNPAPVLRANSDGAICVANPATRQCYEDREVLGASIFSLCPGLKQEDFEALFRADGKMLQIESQLNEVSYFVTLLGDVERGHAYIYAADITQIKQLEAQIRQSQKMEAVGLLAGGIAHDFNSLLGVILGYGDMMRDDIPASSPVRGNLEEIITAGKRSRDMVSQLMAFGRPSEEEPTPVQLAPLVEGEIRLLRASLPATIRIAPDIKVESARILANASQIRQVVMNLGINAGNAIGENHGVVQIGLAETGVDAGLAGVHGVEPGAYLQLTVSDNGRGMDEETMVHIFEPFFTSNVTSESSGLGLAIVHSNVKRHGGFVTVESEPGKGSSFHVYLPEKS